MNNQAMEIADGGTQFMRMLAEESDVPPASSSVTTLSPFSQPPVSPVSPVQQQVLIPVTDIHLMLEPLQYPTPLALHLQTLYQNVQQQPFNLPEPLARALVEQIAADEANLQGPGPNFGPHSRDWAERLVAARAPLAAPHFGGLFGVPASRPVRDPSEVERLALVDRVHSALLREISAPIALQKLEQLVAVLSQMRVDILTRLARWSECCAISDFLTLEDQQKLQSFEAFIPQLFNVFAQQSKVAIAALRFAANVLVLRVAEWKTEQRQRANQAAAREKRHKKGRYVKALPEMRRALDQLAQQVVTFGKHMFDFVSQVQMLGDSLAPELLCSPAERTVFPERTVHRVQERKQQLDAIANALIGSLQLLAEHTVVIQGWQ